MSTKIEAIGAPLVKHRLFDSVDKAFEMITLNYVQRQMQKYQRLIRKFERKYRMSYTDFQKFTREQAQKLLSEPSNQEEFLQLEDDAFDWKVALDGFGSWRQVHQEIISCL
ncbi:MAG: hypothetical protein ONB27_14650 [candidate division KSB1 bacterium]|nr:hypothetical protein [candidate division KSB1 bacterium]